MTAHSGWKAAPDVPRYGNYRLLSLMSLIRDNFATFRPVRPSSTNRFRTRGEFFIANHSQVVTIIAVRELLTHLRQIRLGDEFHPQRHLFETRHFETMSVFDRGEVVAGFEQTRLRSGIDARNTTAEQYHHQMPFLEVTQ